MEIWDFFVNLFKGSGAKELSVVGQIIDAVDQTFIVEKFNDGVSGRDAAIDAVIAGLKTLKSQPASNTTTSA